MSQHVRQVILAGQAEQHAGIVLASMNSCSARRGGRDARPPARLRRRCLSRACRRNRARSLYNGRHAQGVHLARHQGGERGEELGRIGHVAQFVGVRIVRLRHRIQGVRSPPSVSRVERPRSRSGGPSSSSCAVGIPRAPDRPGMPASRGTRRRAWGKRSVRGGVSEEIRRRACSSSSARSGSGGRTEARPVLQAHQHDIAPRAGWPPAGWRNRAVAGRPGYKGRSGSRSSSPAPASRMPAFLPCPRP